MGHAQPHAAELVKLRANSAAPDMGMTSHPFERVPLEDAKIAKNYLAEDELQALNRKLITTRDWIAKLDDFLKLSDREILNRAGRVSQSEAHDHARLE